MAIVGIDLGTTNSLVCAYKDGKVQPIPNGLGSVLTPSVVSLDEDGTVLVGAAARERLITHSDRSASVFKRSMGTDQVYKLGKHTFRAEELSALVLKSLKADAEAFLGEPVDQAVISVPAYFNENQRKATKAAAQIAGINVERLINEPTAAAIAYGVNKIDSEGTFLVLDLGGGTFDVSILELFDKTLEVHASSGDTRLGGEDFRWRLAQRFLESNNLKWDELDGQERATVMRLAEEAKVELSLNQTALVECHLHGKDIIWPISREEFEGLCHDLLERLRRPVERALSDAKLSPDNIDEILLVGGATRMPMIKVIAEKLFEKAPRTDLDPDRVVGIGAGIQAMLMTCDEAFDDVVMTDVCPWSLGIELVSSRKESDPTAPGDFEPIIERNTTVPVSRRMHVVPVHPKQKILLLRIFQGESRRVENNILLGTVELQIKPEKDVSLNAIDVRFTYDVNGLLEVQATHLRNHQTWRLVLEKSPGTMTPEQIEACLKKLAPLKMHPRDRQEYRHLLALIERLYEDHVGEDRNRLGMMMTGFESVLESQDLKACEKAAEHLRGELRDCWNLEA